MVALKRSPDRRAFLALAAGGLAASVWGPRWLGSRPARQRLQAVAFDGFTIFDPRPITVLTEELFPGKGQELSNAWRTRQFEYQWLRALSGRYADFWQITRESLVFATKSLGLALTAETSDRLMQGYLGLKVWPDVQASLRTLKESGMRLALLSNMTGAMLNKGIEKADLKGVFEHVLSTDAIKAYKPDPRAYQLGIDAFRLDREAVLFAAFAGWDAAGARWFGYPTFWVNRLGFPDEELGVTADAAGRTLQELIEFVIQDRPSAVPRGRREPPTLDLARPARAESGW